MCACVLGAQAHASPSLLTSRMVGFADDAGRYFFFVAALLAHELSTAALFRFFSFLAPSEELAQAAAGISTVSEGVVVEGGV